MKGKHMIRISTDGGGTWQVAKPISYKPKQKFPNGTRVRIADDLGSSMDHFPKGCYGTVVGTYASQYSGDNVNDYTIDVDGHGETSWYQEHQLTAIEENT